MKQRQLNVVRVESDTSGDPEWKVTVSTTLPNEGGRFYEYDLPDPADLPPDVIATLMAWCGQGIARQTEREEIRRQNRGA